MIDLTPLVRIGLLLVRPGFLIATAPSFGGTYAPAPVKIGLTVLIAIILMPSVGGQPSGDVMSLSLVIVREAAIGLALALSIRAMVAAFEFAGQLSGFQMGLSYAATIDPQSGVRNNMLSSLYSNIALMALFLVNGHHAILRALRSSYESLPIGIGSVSDAVPETVTGLLGLVFVLGTRLAAPLILVLVVSEIAMGMIARSAPMLNLLAIGVPLRVLLGLALLIVVAPAASGLASDVMNVVVQLGVRAAETFP